MPPEVARSFKRTVGLTPLAVFPPEPPMAPSAARPAPPPATSARYAYLVGRLRARQITMEEATELFGIMQGMLRESLAVRARLEGARTKGAPSPPPPAPAAAPTAPSPTAPVRGAPPADDLLLLGLLALGAGAGLGAAFARRLGQATRPPEGTLPSAASGKGRPSR